MRSPSNRLEIEGKTFEFFGEVLRDGQFVKIWEKGRTKIRRALLTASMVQWLGNSLSPVGDKKPVFVKKKRFGRVLVRGKVKPILGVGFLTLVVHLRESRPPFSCLGVEIDGDGMNSLICLVGR